MKRALLLLCLACGGSGSRSSPRETPDVLTTEAAIRGTITHRGADRILIEEEPLDSSGSAKASVRLTSATRVLRGGGETGRRDDLTVGQEVSAWFDGPVMESYPVQATASAVRIESEGGSGNQMEINGVVRYYELEGGFYGIRTEEGETYNPINLPAEFREDGLPVRAKVRLRNDMMGVHQAGPLVEILEIGKR